MHSQKQRAVASQKSQTASSSPPNRNYAALAQQLLQLAAMPCPEPSEEAAPSKASAMAGGGLFLVATPIGHRGDITLRALLTLAEADAVLCEDTRVSGALLRAYGIKRPLISYHEHNATAREAELLERLQAGARLALISDAGMPLVADPGFRLVRLCREQGIAVTVCPGASALLTALTQTALPQLPFLFGGFLPPKSAARQKTLQGWRQTPATLVFYETPQRLAASLGDMLAVLGNRAAAVGRELTKLYEECRHGTLAELVAHYTAQPPKGEIVVVIAPPAEDGAVPDVTGLLKQALATQSLRDAVAQVMAATGQPRTAVYPLALALKAEGKAEDAGDEA